MRLPYVQFHQAAYALAPVLGSYLKIHRQRAMGMLLDLWRHGLEKTRDEDMPTGMIESPNVVRAIAAICDWEGDARLLVDSLVELGFLVLNSPKSARVRGMSRYVKVLEDAAERREHAKKAINARWARHREAKGHTSDTRVLPENNLSSTREVLNDTQHNSIQNILTKTAAETTNVGRRPEPAAEPPAAVLDPFASPAPEPADEPPGGSYMDCWRWMSDLREQLGRPKELRQPRGFERWHALAVTHAGTDGIQRAYSRYLDDEDFKPRQWATAVFMSANVWTIRAYEEQRKVRL